MSMVSSRFGKTSTCVVCSVGLVFFLFGLASGQTGGTDPNYGCDEQSKTATLFPDWCKKTAVECKKEKTGTKTVEVVLTVDAEGKIIVVGVSSATTVTASVDVDEYQCTLDTEALGPCASKEGVDWGSASGTVSKIKAHECSVPGTASGVEHIQRTVYLCKTGTENGDFVIPVGVAAQLKAKFPNSNIPAGFKIPYTYKTCIATDTNTKRNCGGEYKLNDSNCFNP